VKKLVGVIGMIGVFVALLVGPSSTQDAVSADVPRVAVAGTPSVGSTLTVVPARWPATPDARTYEWLRDGEGDVLGRSSTYTPSEADLRHTLVVVERVQFGADRDESSSAPVTVAAAGAAATPAPAPAPAPAAPAITPAVNQRPPSIKGTAKVGKRLSVRSKGTWVAPGHTFAYQWLRNGKKIARATASSYKLTRKDRKKRISLRVYAQRSGYPTIAATSKASKKVR
jgi:hypothetical protein